MTTTAMHLAGRRDGRATDAADRRRATSRPIVDLAPWVGPLAWMAIVALIVAGLGVVALLRDGVPSDTSTTISVRVSPSDTLWSIAEANRLPGVSTAATVEAITRTNDLQASSLTPGTVLRVPAQAPVGSALAQASAEGIGQ